MMRFNLLISPLILTFLTGCTSLRSGNSINVSESFQKGVAKDTVKELANLYPPARTQLQIREVPPNSYSTSLIEILRKQGYAVVETKESWFQKKTLFNTPSTALFYAVDKLTGSNLYRVSVAIGQQHLSRAYTLKNGQALGLGSWTKVG